jgi:xanthine/uracil permease
MTWYDAKRLIAVMLLFFGLVGILNTVVLAWAVPNTLILGVLLLMFGRQMYQEAVLDKMSPSEEKQEG